MKKQEYIKRFSVTKVGYGHYSWTYRTKIGVFTKTLTDAETYDRFKDDTINLTELKHLAKLIRK